MNRYWKVGLPLLLLFTQCAGRKHNHFDQRQLLGKWWLDDEDKINYPGLRFDPDSSAVFSSRGDTIYYYVYHIKGDTLMLNNKYGGRIKTLTDNELVFYDLLEKDSRQVYHRPHQ